MSIRTPMRSEIWFAELDPTRGHEQGGRRPCLVISNDMFNEGPAGLVVVLPVTSKDKHIRFHIPIDPPEGGLKIRSFIKPEDIRSISRERLVKKTGAVSAATMKSVTDRLRVLLDIYAFED